jgi:uncharacterized RDD family membrane protein YckC
MEPTQQSGGLPSMPKGAWETAEPAQIEGEPVAYASWGARVGAYLLDGLLMAIPYVLGIIFIIVGAAAEDDGRDGGTFYVLGVLLIIASVVVPFIYFPILNGNERGQTLGKRVTNIRVRRSNGTPLGVGRGLGRYSITFLFGLLTVLLIGFVLLLLDDLWPLWDSRNQALHDKVVDSIVVKA